MANNQYVNKVVNGESGDVLIDLTADTITASSLMQGYTAHDKSGAPIVGTSTGGGTEAGTVTQDPDGYLVLDDDPPTHITVESLSVTQNGTYTAPTGKAYSPVTVSVSGGGGGGDMSDPIRFFDYDGTLVASYSSVPASLPSVPSHPGLTNGTWNYTLAQVQTQFSAMGTCDVGANYETASGKTEIDCEFVAGRLSPYLRFTVNGTVTVDWGDGSATETMTGTSLTARKDMPHTYAEPGSYTITIAPDAGTTYAMYGSSTYTLLHKNSSTANANKVYANCVKAVRIGANCTIGSYAFNYCSIDSISIPGGITAISTALSYCHALKYVSIPSGVETLVNSSFLNCYSLKSVSIPIGLTTINMSSFGGCYSMTKIVIPSGVTTLGNSVFNSCYSLQDVSIPSGITSLGSNLFGSCQELQSVSTLSGATTIGSSAFSYCQSLASLSFGSSLSSISASAFINCYGVSEYHFTSAAVPTLANINAFTGIESDCIIYVPSAKLNDYKTAENWSTYASYMVGE